jgi:SAM-dependent methyltransferase
MSPVPPDSAVIAYHLRELATAQDPSSPDYVMPDVPSDARAILDIGCGIGQTLFAIGARTPVLVGLDPDRECLAYGFGRFPHIRFINGTAEALPFPDATFDLVVCRVSLPYTNLQRSLSEVCRVLTPGGTVWFSLHSFRHVAQGLLRSVRRLRVREALLRTYVIANGLAFHVSGHLFALRIPFASPRYESFQTIGGMTAAMHRRGFDEVWARSTGRHLLCTATKRAKS